MHSEGVGDFPPCFVIFFTEANHDGPNAAAQRTEDGGADFVAFYGAGLVLVKKLEKL
jgi:hypothetical protein